jgi:hypothetical protein
MELRKENFQSKGVPDGFQTKMEFPDEKEEIARKYNITALERLEKVDGVWKMGGIPVEVWAGVADLKTGEYYQGNNKD